MDYSVDSTVSGRSSSESYRVFSGLRGKYAAISFNRPRDRWHGPCLTQLHHDHCSTEKEGHAGPSAARTTVHEP